MTGEASAEHLGRPPPRCGQEHHCCHTDQLGAVLAAQLQRIIAPPYRIETGIIAESEGRRGGPFAALICNGDQPIAAAGADAVVPTESMAVAFDVTHTLDLNGLAVAYDRIAAAKAMRKTAPAPGARLLNQRSELFSPRIRQFRLEELADELEPLNARTLSDQSADMVVVATKGQISYSVQMVGSSKIDGMLLPASPGAKDGAIFYWLGNPKMRRPAETSSNGNLGHG